MDLKSADPDPGLLDEGSAGTARRYSVCVALIHHENPCQRAIQYGFKVMAAIMLGITKPRRMETRMDSTCRWVRGAVPRFDPLV